jgi:cytochrome c-type biogenesis protein CcmH/NrfG
MYQEFLVMYDEILEEQEVARELKRKKERDTAWQLEHRKEILTAKVVYVIALAMGLLELIGLYSAL